MVAVTWNHENQFSIEKTHLYPSFKKQNPDQEFVHIHFNRNDYQKLEEEFSKRFEREYCFLLYKIQLLGEKIKEHVKTDYIIVADATDVFCLGKVSHLVDSYDLNEYIIACQEKNTWPTTDHKKHWPDYTDYSDSERYNRTFLNSGMLLARTDKFIEMLDSMIKNVLSTDCKYFHNCQGCYTYYYNKKFQPEIKLDCSSIFTLNTFTRTKEECYLNEEKRIVIKETGVKPCFVHDNGWNHGSPKFINQFELKRLYSDTYAHLKNLSNEKPMPQSHTDYLFKLKNEFNFNPKVIWDVGACVLYWTNIAKEVWPNSEYVLFEAMEESEDLFVESNHKYCIGVFSDVDEKEITFYKNVTFPAGNSYYMENPKHSGMAEALFANPSNQFLRKTITLDTAQKKHNFPMPDLLKIDVQGCEVDILKGASNVLQYVKHLIVELQHIEYNIGAQLCDNSIPFIESLGFKLVEKFSLSSHADADYHFERAK